MGSYECSTMILELIIQLRNFFIYFFQSINIKYGGKLNDNLSSIMKMNF